MNKIEEEIKQAELNRLNQELLNLESEKPKTDKEKEEIDKRMYAPFIKSKNFIQLIFTALAFGPLI